MMFRLPSGRGVRMRTLSYVQSRQVFEEAVREVGQEATMFAAKAAEGAEGVRTCLAAVTKELVADRAALLAAEWTPVTNQHLAEVGFDRYFTTRDVAVLVGLYQKLHHTSDKELEEIMGEALPDTED
jgi:hypothetical protein